MGFKCLVKPVPGVDWQVSLLLSVGTVWHVAGMVLYYGPRKQTGVKVHLALQLSRMIYKGRKNAALIASQGACLGRPDHRLGPGRRRGCSKQLAWPRQDL